MRASKLRRLGGWIIGELWPFFGLLVGTFAIILLGVTDNINGLSYAQIWPLTLIGLLLGWALAASSTSGLASIVTGSLVGVILVITQVGRLGSLLVALIGSIYDFIRQVLTSSPLGISQIYDNWIELESAVEVLLIRVVRWVELLVRGEPLFDPVATIMLWLLLFWVATVWAAWALRRRKQPLMAVLPALFLLAVMTNTTRGSALLLAPALAFSLLMKAKVSLEQLELNWRAETIDYSPRVNSSTNWIASGLVIGLMVIAWITPSLSIYQLVDYARDLTQLQRNDELARSLGLEPRGSSTEMDAFSSERFGGLPASHLIGSGPELSEQLVMTITVEDPVILAERHRYWRGVTYDRYTGRGWETRGTKTIQYEAGEKAGRKLEKQRLIRQQVDLQVNLDGIIYVAGELTSIDQPFQVAWRARFQGTQTYTDLFASSTINDRRGGYRADSLIPHINESQLRAANQDYPDRIERNYLALPDDLSERVRILARDLTATEATAYDRALAIEQYLRQFTYDLDLPPPPADKEISDYFLFELQRGYCDYYATGMVMLARAAGLPARLATGYIGGIFDEQAQRFQVTADLAHSWPEIYFPGHGWVPFEPTAGRAAIDRPEEHQPADELASEEQLEPITARRDQARWTLIFQITTGLLLLLLIISGVWWFVELWRLRTLSPGQAIPFIYHMMYRHSRRLELTTQPGMTPHEYAVEMGKQLDAVSTRGRIASMLHGARESVHWLTDQYVNYVYSPLDPDAEDRNQAIKEWSRLRIQLLWATLMLKGRLLLRRLPVGRK